MKTSLEQLSAEELSGLVNIYPWFSAARVMLGHKLVEAGGWSREELGQAMLHISDPSILRPFVKALLVPEEPPVSKPTPSRKRVAGGDFFSREEYEKVRFEEDDFFKKPIARNTQEKRKDEEPAQLDFITETLAQIYAEQGYLAQAKEIYEKLILAYPKKSAYFAALIEKLNN